jgi:hypothetical protein
MASDHSSAGVLAGHQWRCSVSGDGAAPLAKPSVQRTADGHDVPCRVAYAEIPIETRSAIATVSVVKIASLGYAENI